MVRTRMMATAAATAISAALLAGMASAQDTTPAPPAPENTKPAPAVPAAAATPAADVPAADASARDTGLLQPRSGLAAVVVTATGRSQPLQTVPAAVSAFGIEDLAARGIDTPFALGRTIPNMITAHDPGLGTANAYYIRGVGTTESLATIDPPVGTFVDGIYLARQGANDFGLFDVERIEVLRGPESILFGRNTSGGAVDVLMRAPADRIAGYFEGGYGAYGRREFRGSLDIPAGAVLSTKLSGYYQDDHGVAKNTTTGQRTNENNRAGIRGAVKAQLSDQLSWNASLAYMRNDSLKLPSFSCDPNDPANCKGRFVSTGLLQDYDAAHPSPFTALGVTGRKAEFGLQNHTGTGLLTSNIAWAGDNFTANFITGVVKTRQKYTIDLADGRGFPNDAVPVPPATSYAVGYDILNDSRNSEFSQEVRVGGSLFGGRVDYLVGGSYYHETNTTDLADVAGPGTTPLLLADRALRNKTNAYAGYVEVDGHLSSALKVSGGVRYTDEKDSFDVADNRPQCAVTPLPVLCLSDANLAVLGIAQSQHDKYWTPRAEVDYQLAGIMLYASATRGTRSAGWNGRGTTPAALQPFGREKAWSYEGGIRSELFDQRLRLNLTGFYVDTKHAQVSSAFIDPVTDLPDFTTDNAAGSRNYGIEAEAVLAPLKGLSLYANAGYQHDRYKVADGSPVRLQQAACLAELAAGRVPLAPVGSNNAPDCARGIVTAGGDIARPVRTPDVTLAAGGSYDYAIPPAGIILRPSVNAIYRTSFETGTANASLYAGNVTAADGTVYPANPFGGGLITGSHVKSHVEVDAVLAMLTDDNNWIVSVECSNCLDKTSTDASLLGYSYLNPPRTWLVRAKRTF